MNPEWTYVLERREPDGRWRSIKDGAGKPRQYPRTPTGRQEAHVHRKFYEADGENVRVGQRPCNNKQQHPHLTLPCPLCRYKKDGR
jgi:hypothetical protein